MENKSTRTMYLLERFRNREATHSEMEELFALLEGAESDEANLQLIMQPLESQLAADLDQEEWKKLAREILDHKRPRVVTMRRRTYVVRWAAAAVLIGVAILTGIILTREKPTQSLSVYKNDVAPGKPGAKLKLSGGRILQLDSLTDGLIANEGGYQIYKQNGEIIYKGNASAVTEVLYNELIADKKQMSRATLPDGTIAWVNAASSVRYPVYFTGSERKVTMTGEAIFKVTHNEKQPFRVFAGDKVFEDKGTEFDINAYNTNVITATVAEGLVQTGNVGIKAGQQATIDERGKINVSANADMETIFAWRDGQFTFSNATIEEVMKQAELWYDIEVVYEGRTDQRFIFSADRSKPISNLLHKIEESSGVHFEIDGRKVTVRP